MVLNKPPAMVTEHGNRLLLTDSANAFGGGQGFFSTHTLTLEPRLHPLWGLPCSARGFQGPRRTGRREAKHWRGFYPRPRTLPFCLCPNGPT